MATHILTGALAVRELPPAEQPVMRLRHGGAATLSLVELLTIVLSAQTDAPARAMLELTRGSVRGLAEKSTGALKVPGVGSAGAARVLAALELGKRAAAETHEERPSIRSPKDVARRMAPVLEYLPVEEFHVLVLDVQHRLERDILVTRGTLTSSLVHPREVFREAIQEKAAAIILCHNHPSGDPTPSTDDRQVTEMLVAAGKTLDIPVHDHLIIGRGRYTSFAEAGLL